ncbi:carboxylesterase family protein [Nonomuraea gerenzanensis]|uniref:Carboxylesterase, type B n=1 Tax=Nonomuraea gerenzanensis TaxID=93944 RepID=A0A1M4ECF1_9ACTN|nr:carboxylesterase family protein [Nonomuraea gerenzanensis]SBO96595.1 carboxylesterase, type B [Nonomuraea gerenzanensis]
MTLARTPLGTLRGLTAGGVTAFKGVRYAAPARRLAAPEPALPWDGVRDAVAPGPPAPQPWVPVARLVTTAAEETRLFTAIGQDGLDTQEISGGPADGIAPGASRLVDVPLYFGTHGTPLTGTGPEVAETARSMSDEFARFCRG